jgi:hypothetical protein
MERSGGKRVVRWATFAVMLAVFVTGALFSIAPTVLLATAPFAPRSARADALSDFYKTKSLTLAVFSSAGAITTCGRASSRGTWTATFRAIPRSSSRT